MGTCEFTGAPSHERKLRVGNPGCRSAGDCLTPLRQHALRISASLDIEEYTQFLLIETDDYLSINHGHGCRQETQFLKFVQGGIVLADIPILI